MRETGYVSFDKGSMRFISADRDPKALKTAQ